MRYLALIILLFVCGCIGKSDGPAISKKARPLNNTEFVIWELTIGCFMDSGIEPFVDMEYEEPKIRVIPDVSGKKACGQSVAACAVVWDNIVIVKEEFYYDDWGINKTLFVHEFKHLILFQAGENYNHESYWYDFNGTGEGDYPFGLDMSPCPDALLVGEDECQMMIETINE